MDGLTIIPAPSGSGDYVELARTRQAQGRVFRKHILNLGTLIHPKTGQRLKLDDAWYGRLKDNFDRGVCDIVQVPLADAQNQHSEDPRANIGEVIDIEREGSKVYSVIDVRDADAADKLGKTLLGASAFLSLDYTDTRTGQKVGPALLHHCVTNRPYVVGLEDYAEVLAASNAAGEEPVVMVLTAEEPPAPLADNTIDALLLPDEESEVPLSRDELIEQLKAEHGIDVEALQAQASSQPDLSQFTAALTEALRPSGDVGLTGGDGETVSLTDVIGAVAELAQTNVELSGKVTKLERGAAEHEVDGYIGDGRLLPKSRRKAIELVLSGDREGLEDFLAPANAPYVKLNHSEGAAPPQGEQRQVEDIDTEIMRLTAAPEHAHLFNGDGRK